MGLGDELMALGEARARYARTRTRVQIVDRHGKRRAHFLWQGASYVARLHEHGKFEIVVNGSNCRPYIDYDRTTKQRWVYRDYKPCPGELFNVRPNEKYRGYVMLEPNVKPNASPNKQWGWDKWQTLVEQSPETCFVQTGPKGTRWLRGVQRVLTTDFADAVNVLAAAYTAVLPEGGLHHAAAALGKPVVVLFGGYNSPRQTGYDFHINMAVDSPEAEGWRVLHPACKAAWDQITVSMIQEALARIEHKTSGAAGSQTPIPTWDQSCLARSSA